MAAPVTAIPSENDWQVGGVWAMNQNEPLGATAKRVRWSFPADTIVRIGFPERVPGTGPSYTEPFRAGDIWVPVPGSPSSEPVSVIPIALRSLEFWIFTPSTP